MYLRLGAPRVVSMPAALSSRRFCRLASRFASPSCFSRALRFAFLPRVLARRARASLSISFSSSSMSTGSGRAGLVSGAGSISPGRSRRGSPSAPGPPASSPSPPSRACALSSSRS